MLFGPRNDEKLRTTVLGKWDPMVKIFMPNLGVQLR